MKNTACSSLALHQNLIDGDWVGNRFLHSINPSDLSEIVGDFASATAEKAQAAIAAARAAFPAWSRPGILERARRLRDTAREILRRKDEIGALTEKMAALRVGHAMEPSTQIGPVVDAGQLKQDLTYTALGQGEGARPVAGGEQPTRPTEGYCLTPALFTDCTPEMRLMREEIFGPVARVIRVRDYDEALTLANGAEFGLSAGICTTSLKHATRFRRNAEAGMAVGKLPTAGVVFICPSVGAKDRASVLANKGAMRRNSSQRSRRPACLAELPPSAWNCSFRHGTVGLRCSLPM
jgi:acyl-CoA reductase-like NAD-dependent aldehyde dehydrogenase